MNLESLSNYRNKRVEEKLFNFAESDPKVEAVHFGNVPGEQLPAYFLLRQGSFDTKFEENLSNLILDCCAIVGPGVTVPQMLTWPISAQEAHKYDFIGERVYSTKDKTD
jgi:hypothetical protein